MNTKSVVKEVCPTSAQLWVKRGALLVDVREADEVALLSYDVPNIVNIPITEFEHRYKELPVDKELVLVCKAGVRSLRAAVFLIIKGYHPDKIVNMRHGIIRWAEKGFPIKGDISAVLENGTEEGCCDSATTKKHLCCGSSSNDDSN